MMCGSSSLRELASFHIHEDDDGLLVADVRENGVWRLDRLRYSLPADLIQCILYTPAAMSHDVADSWLWGLAGDGQFSVSSAQLLDSSAVR